MTFYGVIDTNVVVSSMLKKSSVPGKIVDYALVGTIVPLLNEEIVNEYIDVLSRNEFGFDKEDISLFIDNFKEKGIFLNRTKTLEDFIDMDDAVFYEVVMTARNTADAYLVTGNLKHYPVKPYVVTPREMLEIIEGK